MDTAGVVHCHADVMCVCSVTILSLEGYNNSMNPYINCG